MKRRAWLLLFALPFAALPFAALAKPPVSEWKSLFNGMSLDGWKVIGDSADKWKVEDGVMVSVPGHGWISTTDEYENFELELEFKLSPGGNSGVFLRTPHAGNPTYAGMEIQILDDPDKQYANIEKWQHCGSLYGIMPAKLGALKKAGEWQTYRIVCDGRKASVMLNGVEVVSVNLDDHKDKLKEHPGIGEKTGHIGLQNHSTRVEFRNIRVRKLP